MPEIDLDYPRGPWNELFYGIWSKYPVTVLENTKKQLLVIIREPKSGADILRIDEALVVDKAPDEVVHNLGRRFPLINIFQRSGEYSGRYVLVSTDPVMVTGKEQGKAALPNMMNELMDRVELAQAQLIKLGLQPKRLFEAGDIYVNKLLGEPSLIPSIVVPMKDMVVKQSGAPSAGGPAPLAVQISSVPFGITRMGDKVDVSLDSFKGGALLVQGSARQKKYAAQLVIEGALLNRLPVIVFDLDGVVSGLTEPNPQASAEFGKFKMESAVAFGFPVVRYIVGEPNCSLHIDINTISGEALVDVLGLGNDECGKVMVEALKVARGERKTFGSLIEFMQYVVDSAQKSDTGLYASRKAMRVLKVLSLQFPNVFGGRHDVSEFFRHLTMGKVSIIDLSSLKNEMVCAGVVESVLNGIKEYLKAGTPQDYNAVVFVFGGERMLPTVPAQVNREIMRELSELQNLEVGVCVSGTEELDVNQEYVSKVHSTFNIVGERDCVITQPGVKPLRIWLRPTLSQV